MLFLCCFPVTIYGGGELELNIANPTNKNKNNIITLSDVPRGTVIVFPSFMWHRVKPVTSGTRYSLVVWNLGRPFR
jgi:predicted 2-oxoglutarate/Fe(II)-dependent dioxygenase YbiX